MQVARLLQSPLTLHPAHSDSGSGLRPGDADVTPAPFTTAMATPPDALAEAFRWAHVAVGVLHAVFGEAALQAALGHPPSLNLEPAFSVVA